MVQSSLTVLVVDDETLLLRSIAEVLRRGGHTVMQTASAAAGRSAIDDAGGRIDVVLMGDRLPDSPSLRFLDELRARLPRAAVVIMSAARTAETTHAAVERGAYGVLPKPFDLLGIEKVVAAAHRWSVDR
jgi:DNA-binding NtrC family response regulator